MTVMSDAIEVHGIAELRKALKRLGNDELVKELTASLKKAATIVADDARSRVPSRTGRARGSIRAGTSGPRGLVVGGKKAVPYYGWLDFGSRVAQIGNPRSVGPWRRSGTGPAKGRFIYPALEHKWDQVVSAVDDGVEDVIRKAGFY